MSSGVKSADVPTLRSLPSPSLTVSTCTAAVASASTTETSATKTEGQLTPISGVDIGPLDELAFEVTMRDAKVGYLKSLVGTPTFSLLFARLAAQEEKDREIGLAKHLPFHQTLLLHAEAETKKISSTTPKGDTTECYNVVISAADKCIDLIDSNAIALNLGMRVDKDDKTAVKTRKGMEEQKDALVDALFSKAKALMLLIPLGLNVKCNVEGEGEGDSVGMDTESYDNTLFLSAYRELLKWDDMTALRFVTINVFKLKIQKR